MILQPTWSAPRRTCSGLRCSVTAHLSNRQRDQQCNRQVPNSKQQTAHKNRVNFTYVLLSNTRAIVKTYPGMVLFRDQTPLFRSSYVGVTLQKTGKHRNCPVHRQDQPNRNMVLQTAFTKSFNLNVPICLAPMAGASGGRLAGKSYLCTTRRYRLSCCLYDARNQTGNSTAVACSILHQLQLCKAR